jgi:hypothetical protein
MARRARLYVRAVLKANMSTLLRDSLLAKTGKRESVIQKKKVFSLPEPSLYL